MESEWQTQTIEEIAEKVGMGPFGSSIKVETFVSEGIPIISGQHLRGSRVDDAPGFNLITQEHAKRLSNANVIRGDIVFTHAGNIGQVAYIPESSNFELYVISQRQFYMRCDCSKAIPEFVTLYFKSPEGQHKLLANTSQVGVPSIAQPVTYLRTIGIPLPSLDEQRAIANVFGALDDKIEQNRKTACALEQLARAIFRAWFVDFEPVKAKANGARSFPSVPQHVFDALPTNFVESEIGPVPEGWNSGLLGDVIDIHDSRRVPLSRREREQRKGSFRYYGATGIIDHVNDFLFDGVFVLVGEDGTVVNDQDRPVVQYVWGKFWVNNHAHVLTGSSGISTDHLRVLLDHINIRPFLTGAVQPKLNQRNLKSVPILIPPSVAVAAFGDVIAPLFTCLRQVQDQSHVLESVRDLLLPQLLSGQVRLEAADG